MAKRKVTPPVEQVETQSAEVELEIGTKLDEVQVVEAPVEVQAPAKTPRFCLGVGKFVMNLIKTQPELTNTQLLDEVKKKFGDQVKTTKACIAWYKTASKK
jgi:hypothetical protein